MNKLETELARLYLLPDPQPGCHDPAGPEHGLINAAGEVRAMVVDIRRQAGWDRVAALWHGIQDDLDLPAPAIAVSGIDSFQVWLSLAEPVSVTHALDFLDLLRLRYLGAIAPGHIGLKPVLEASAPQQARHAPLVPALQTETGHWSAFVAPGLAGMFAEEPWLDLAPNPEAQASILSRCESIKPANFRIAFDRLRPADAPILRDNGSAPNEQAGGIDSPIDAGHVPLLANSDPKRFLLDVMNDPGIELHLRIEAAKALLPYSHACVNHHGCGAG